VPPFPRLGFPLWNPSSEAPPYKVRPKGETHPSPPLESKSVEPLLGERRKPLRGLPCGARFLKDLFSPWPSARAAAACPLWPSGLLGHVLGATTERGGFGFQGPEVRGPESQRLSDLSPARPCHKATFVEDQVPLRWICGPIRPPGAPYSGQKNNSEGKGQAKGKSYSLLPVGG
jgi:hypothetical protein